MAAGLMVAFKLFNDKEHTMIRNQRCHLLAYEAQFLQQQYGYVQVFKNCSSLGTFSVTCLNTQL